MAERKAMIDREHALSISRQAELVDISRGTVYYQPQPVSEADLKLMRRIDELHLQRPTAGSRMLRDLLRSEGFEVGRRHVRSLMRLMGIETIYCQPRTSDPHPGHKIYPYLLRDISIDHANQVWALDTTYVPMAQGFVYLTAVLDIASRKVLAHKVAISLEACHAVEVIEQAFARYGLAQIVNTDQGSQFTAEDFTQAVLERGCQLSMDGRGAWRDNVFVERLWRTVKYDEIYLKAYDNVSAAREGIATFLDWYNNARPHSSLDARTPSAAYRELLATPPLAA